MPETKPEVVEATENPTTGTKTVESLEVKPVKKAELPGSSKENNVTKADDSAEAKPDENAGVENSSNDNDTTVKDAEKASTTKSGGAKDEGSKSRSDDRSDDERPVEKSRDDDRYRRNGHRSKPKRRGPNNKFDNLPESSDPAEIRKQVEFYFSDQNIAMDEHIFYGIDGSKNRPMSLKHIASFNRMRRFQPYSAVVAALRDSEFLEVVEDGEYRGNGNEGIKRKVPITIPKLDGDKEEKELSLIDEFNRVRFNASKNSLTSSIIAKGFGTEEEAPQVELEEFFRPYGAIAVRMRREKDDGRAFKGSVFVEFENDEAQKQFLALDPKPKWKDNELFFMGKKEYNEMKCAEKGIEPGTTGELSHWKYRGPHQPRRGGDRTRRDGGRSRRDDYRRRRSDSHSRSRSPYRHRRRRDSRSRSSDSDDWKDRRDKFQKSRDYRGRDSRNGHHGKGRGKGGERRDHRDHRDRRDRDEEEKPKQLVDERGVPVVHDTRPDRNPNGTLKEAADKGAADASKKRGRVDDDAGKDDGSKKTKLEVTAD